MDKIMRTKEETIRYLTDLMGVIANAYFKKGMFTPLEYDSNSRVRGDLRVHEGSEGGISIDLYHFEGDGKPVCDGLKPCTITYDDGSQDKGNLFCMCYDPYEEETPLVFLFSHDEYGDGGDIDVEPESIPADVLDNIVGWLEGIYNERRKTKDEKRKTNDVTSYFFYMWNRWSEEECKEAFAGGDYNHFWNKWCEAYDQMQGPRGAAELFYMMLSDSNRDLLVKRACEVYDGQTEITNNQ